MLHERQKQEAKLGFVKLILLILNTACFGVAWVAWYSHRLYNTGFNGKGNLLVVALFAVLYGLFATLYGGFKVEINRTSEVIYSQTISLFITDCIAYIIIWLLSRQLPNVLPLLGSFAAGFLLSTIWAKLANKAANKILPAKRTLLIYDNAEAYRNGREIIEHLPWRFALQNEISVDSDEQNIGWICDEIGKSGAEAVMLCGLRSSQRNTILKYCVDKDIRAYVRPNIGDFMMYSATVMQMANLPVFVCQRSTPNVIYTASKRVFDIILALIALVIASPFMLVTAIAIKAYDGGPVLYKQERLTKDGKRFNVLKFRSMKVDAEKDGVARLASEHDDRITPVGKIIRACRIDELPQIFCILNGSMSCVGPRPERPEIASQYEEQMPEFALRLQAKAGLTGYAQVYGKYNTEPYDKLQMDLMYIAKQSFATDFKIILATIKILFMPESTEGISEGQTTAMSNEKL